MSKDGGEGILVCENCDMGDAILPEYDKIEWIKYFFNITEKELKTKKGG